MKTLGRADADGGNMQPRAVEDLHGALEAAALDTAQQRFGRHPAIGEDDVGDLGPLLAHLAVARADGDAGQPRLHQEGRDAACPRFRRRRAGQHREEPRSRRVGDEPLGAVQHVDIAVAPGVGPEAGGVGAALGLGQAEGTDDLAGSEARQVLPLLRLGAVDDDAQRADAYIGAEEGAEGGRGLADLEGDMHLVGHAQAEPAILCRRRQAEQA